LPDALPTAIEHAAYRERSGRCQLCAKKELAKNKNGQRRRSEIEATLQQGLQLRAERSAAGQFWTFTMSNSKNVSRVTVHARSKRVHEKLESLRPLPQARSIVRAHGSARVMGPPSLLQRARLSGPRLRARSGAKREEGVIRWWSDSDRARANDWRQQRVVRESPRQQIGSLTCGVDAGHCGSLLPFGGGVQRPPPVSPIVSDSVRIAADASGNPIPRAQRSARSVA
jgi:hypothetical protein